MPINKGFSEPWREGPLKPKTLLFRAFLNILVQSFDYYRVLSLTGHQNGFKGFWLSSCYLNLVWQIHPQACGCECRASLTPPKSKLFISFNLNFLRLSGSPFW